MSHTLSCFFLSLFLLSVSTQVNANNSVPVTDLANDIVTNSGITSKPLQPKVVEPSPALLKVNVATANANAQMFDLVELLKRELQKLRGEVEELTYTLGRLKQDQKQRYLDLDRRIVSLSNQPAAVNATQTTSVVSEPIQINESTSLDTVTIIQKAYDPEAEKAAYKAAFTLIRERKYDASIEALLTFVKDYPQGTLLGNAHYWLGEVYAVQGDASLAALSFEYVISEFPEHRKIPDALYKAGVAYQQVGDTAKADVLLKRVLSEYPDSSAARLAQEKVN